MDDTLAPLVQGLDPTRHLVVVTGDHGESLNEDGGWFHLGPLSEIRTRVPMVLWGAGVPMGVMTHATSHVDLLPTLLHALAGRAVPVEHTHGRDLLARTWPDQVLLAAPERWSGRALLIRGAGRLEVRLPPGTRSIHAVHMVDEGAWPDWTARLGPGDATMWSAALAEELGRLVE
jgi:hypothetical protein